MELKWLVLVVLMFGFGAYYVSEYNAWPEEEVFPLDQTINDGIAARNLSVMEVSSNPIAKEYDELRDYGDKSLFLENLENETVMLYVGTWGRIWTYDVTVAYYQLQADKVISYTDRMTYSPFNYAYYIDPDKSSKYKLVATKSVVFGIAKGLFEMLIFGILVFTLLVFGDLARHELARRLKKNK